MVDISVVLWQSEKTVKPWREAVYTIYHIPGVKVGCTIDSFEARIRKQGYDPEQCEVLDLIPDELGDKFAGDVEHFYADWFGYPRGPHYEGSNWDSKINDVLSGDELYKIRSRGGRLGGKVGAERRSTAFFTMTTEQRAAAGRKGGPLGGFVTMGKEKRQEVARLGGLASGKLPKDRSSNYNFNQIYTCQCGKVGKGPAMLGHIRKCGET